MPVDKYCCVVIMKIFKKFLTREASLIAVEGWYDGVTAAWEKQIDIPFAINIFIFQNGIVECWRDYEYLMEIFPCELADWIKITKNQKIAKLSYKNLDNALKLFEKTKANKNQSVIDLLKSIENAKNALASGFSGLVFAYLVPYWQDLFFEKYKKKLYSEKIVAEARKWREGPGDKFFNFGIQTIDALLTAIGEKMKWDVELLKYILFSGLQKSIKKHKLQGQLTLVKRKQTSFVYIDRKILFMPEFHQYLRKKNYKIQKERVVATIKEFKGQIANRGKYKGIAKIVFTRAQLIKIRKGDVIVAPMTSPLYVEAMKKTGAIVTDEGGLLSHAAIVSRELGVPCVVGTKIATKILKDGDMVEVDAEKGIVKKI